MLCFGIKDIFFTLEFLFQQLCYHTGKSIHISSTQTILYIIPIGHQPQISILTIVDNGLEYTALSELWRVPLTRATNADFAHRYELYTINWSLGDSLTLVLH
jgi:hypothetical protein